MTFRVGYIGLGNMGKLIAINQLRSGFDLITFDVRREPLDELKALGARIATSARAVGEAADIIGLSLRDDDQVKAVILGDDGVLTGARPETTIAIHTTCHPSTVREIAEQARAKGVGVLDAPVSNGPVGAANASLCFMVGGDEALFARCRPVFAASGQDIFHVGGLGTGAIAKLAHQAIVVGTISAVAEGMLLAETAGVNLEAFHEVVIHSAARSVFAEQWLSRFKDLDPELVKVMYESVDPALRLGRELNVPLIVTALGQQVLPLRVPTHR
jgi:2-hydroxy-3-oxopropionate reductase